MAFVLKPGVNSDDSVKQVTWYALGVCDAIHNEEFGAELVVTSMNDGQHMEGSKHYTGEALDVRLRDLTPPAQSRYYDAVKAALDPMGYDVVFETKDGVAHLHVEYQPKPGERAFRLIDLDD